MDFVTARELRDKSGDIWQRLEAGEEFVVTRNGKPFALLVRTQPNEVEARLRALRLEAFGQAWSNLTLQAQASGATDLTDEEIQAEIKAVRRDRLARQGAVPVLTAQEPTPPPLIVKAAKAARKTATTKRPNARRR